MARHYDSNGLQHGLNAASAGIGSKSPITGGRLDLPKGHTPVFRATQHLHLSACIEADETVRGLECSYGVFAYRYCDSSTFPTVGIPQHPHCHNPVETPAERTACRDCGGHYCSRHADAAAHDCAAIVKK